jgi:Uma2 family endonuclease
MEEVSMEHTPFGRTMATGTTKLTHADYLLIPDDGMRHELIAGEHFVTPSPSLRHQTVSRNLVRFLDAFVRERRLGEVFFAPLDVILSDFDVVEPDLIFVRQERREILQDWVRGVPDLLVEILSPSNRRHDEVRKRDLYEERGVEEYWIVDPEVECVEDLPARGQALRAAAAAVGARGRRAHLAVAVGPRDLARRGVRRVVVVASEGGSRPRRQPARRKRATSWLMVTSSAPRLASRACWLRRPPR